MRGVKDKQRGVALLLVLILLALMSLLAVRMSGLFVRNHERAVFQRQAQTAFWLLEGSETALLKQLRGDPSRQQRSALQHWRQQLTLQGVEWRLEREFSSAQGCFNLNNLAQHSAQPDTSPARQAARQRVASLLRSDNAVAEKADTLTDALFQHFTLLPDTEPPAAGARWLHSLDQLMPHVATPQQLCLLPAEDSQVDINALTPEQAPLLAGLLTPLLSQQQASELLAARPENGWENLSQLRQYWQQASFAQPWPETAAKALLTTDSHFFRSHSRIVQGSYRLEVVSDIYFNPQRKVAFIWKRRLIFNG